MLTPEHPSQHAATTLPNYYSSLSHGIYQCNKTNQLYPTVKKAQKKQVAENAVCPFKLG
jgi:hypothetical protein